MRENASTTRNPPAVPARDQQPAIVGAEIERGIDRAARTPSLLRKVSRRQAGRPARRHRRRGTASAPAVAGAATGAGACAAGPSNDDDIPYDRQQSLAHRGREPEASPRHRAS